jgi:hypothetical protein
MGLRVGVGSLTRKMERVLTTATGNPTVISLEGVEINASSSFVL